MPLFFPEESNGTLASSPQTQAVGKPPPTSRFSAFALEFAFPVDSLLLIPTLVNPVVQLSLKLSKSETPAFLYRSPPFTMLAVDLDRTRSLQHPPPSSSTQASDNMCQLYLIQNTFGIQHF